MEFKKLEIEKPWYGEHKGKIIATLEVEGKSSKMTVELSESASIEIMKQCAGIVASAAAEKAEEFRAEFLQAIAPDGIEGGAE